MTRNRLGIRVLRAKADLAEVEAKLDSVLHLEPPKPKRKRRRSKPKPSGPPARPVWMDPGEYAALVEMRRKLA